MPFHAQLRLFQKAKFMIDQDYMNFTMCKIILMHQVLELMISPLLVLL